MKTPTRRTPPRYDRTEYYELDLGRGRGVVRVTHRGSYLEINSLSGRLAIRPIVGNVVNVTAEHPETKPIRKRTRPNPTRVRQGPRDRPDPI